MEIWIDTRGTALAGGTGIATYAEGLVSTLDSMGISSQFLRLAPEGVQPSIGKPNIFTVISYIMKALSPSVNIKRDKNGHPYLPFMFRMGNTHFRIFGKFLKLKTHRRPNIMHWTCPSTLKITNTINITTIHDVIPLMHPELTRIKKEKMEKILCNVRDNMDYIITDTEFSRSKIIEYIGVPEDRIVNLYLYACISEEEKLHSQKSKSVAPPDSFLCIGRVEARKNIRRLIISHALSNTKRPLVIVGPDGDDRPDLTPVRADQEIIRIPWCERPSLLKTLSEARALLFPSLAEGFGLPIIEAMSLNVPVMTSKGGATGEVAANAALLVDPLDIEQMSQTIRLLDQMEPDARNQLCEAGRERAKFFSLEMQADRMRKFYKSIGIL